MAGGDYHVEGGVFRHGHDELGGRGEVGAALGRARRREIERRLPPSALQSYTYINCLYIRLCTSYTYMKLSLYTFIYVLYVYETVFIHVYIRPIRIYNRKFRAKLVQPSGAHAVAK